MLKQIFLVVSSLALILTYSTHHELAHVEIYRHFGCDSEISFDGIKFTTSAEEGCPINLEMTKLHLYNEIVGYHLISFYTLGILFFMFYIINVWREDKNNKRLPEELEYILPPTEEETEQYQPEPSEAEIHMFGSK